MKHIFQTAMVAVLLLLLPSCTPHSQNPLLPLKGETFDATLAGLWLDKADGKPVYIHIVPRADGAADMVAIGHEESGISIDSYVVTSTSISDKHYLNIQRNAASESDPAKKVATTKENIIAKYRVDGGELKFWLMSDDAASKLIKDGKLKGTVVEKLLEPDNVEISETSESLRKVLETYGNVLFYEKPAKFKRMK